jgi:hypothetical protein
METSLLVTIIVLVSLILLFLLALCVYKCCYSSSSQKSTNELLSKKKNLTQPQKKSLLTLLNKTYIESFNAEDESQIVYFILPTMINCKDKDELEFLKYEGR